MERNRGPMYKNQIGGVAKRDEQAHGCEVPMVKARRRRFGGRAMKDNVLTWGDLASSLKGQRLQSAYIRQAEREVSSGRSSKPEAEQGNSRNLGSVRQRRTKRREEETTYGSRRQSASAACANGATEWR